MKVLNNQDLQNIIDEIGAQLYQRVVNKKEGLNFISSPILTSMLLLCPVD